MQLRFELNYCVISLLKLLTVLNILNEYYVNCQFSSLGQMKNYGTGSGANSGNNGGGNDDSSTGVVNTNSGTTGVGSGEVLGPRSLQLNGQEPTCEELRAMWRFSKRQSRAAEISNEIPTYRDPFTYNVWDPYYPTTRSSGGGTRLISRHRDPNHLIFGRVITREPVIPARFPGRNRIGGDPIRYYGAETKTADDPQRRRGQFRFAGGSSGNGAANSLTTHHGKFQELKELVWTERAKELAQQRKAEEMAARAAVLKEIANGQSYLSLRPLSQISSSPLMDENRSPHQHNHSGSSGRFAPSTQLVGQRSVFSGNPSSTSGRTGGVLLPSMVVPENRALASNIGSDIFSESGVLIQPKNLPMRPSHFRERNRSMFRQNGTPTDFYLREARNPGFSAYRNWEKNPTINTVHDVVSIDEGKLNEENSDDPQQLNTQQLQELSTLLQKQKYQISEDFLRNIFYN